MEYHLSPLTNSSTYLAELNAPQMPTKLTNIIEHPRIMNRSGFETKFTTAKLNQYDFFVLPELVREKEIKFDVKNCT